MNGLPDMDTLLALVRLTFNKPRAAAADVLRMMPRREALWLMFALIVVLTVMLGLIAALMGAGPELTLLGHVLLQGGAFLLVVTMMYLVGRSFGGTGSFDGAFFLVIWLQAVFLVIQVAQIVIFLIMPPFAGLIAILSVVLFLWLLVNFTAELHGFASMGLVFVGVLGTFLAVSLVLVMIAAIIGIELQPGLTP